MGKPWGHQPWENDTAQDFTDKDWFGRWERATKPKLRRNMRATILVLKKFAD